ncbi:MAG: enoyl-CoA hydratase/isomerase family protein [Candidatus Hydrogenedentes bacterium]|nr:enoyl-CoA hydratase/isomerase family protein [Candidatus Hydrogenedentota bacterium]
MAYEYLEVERDGNVAMVTLNRPDKRNALSIAVRDELDACVGEFEADDSVSVIVLLTNGKVYCAGFDTSEFMDRSPEHVQAMDESSERYHRRFAECTKPIVTGVQGPAMGGGFDLAVLCDIRIASKEAVFAHPEIKFGAPVLFGPLREIVGGGPARDLCLTGRKIDADEAYRIGLVSKVVEPDTLRQICLDFAKQIAEAPMKTLQNVKGQIVRSYGGWEPQGGSGGLFDNMK